MPLADGSPILIVVDEACSSLRDAVAELSASFVFKRTTGFLADPGASAEQLHAEASQRSDLPFVYVASSYAAFTALHLAARYPASLAGLVLLDGSHPRQSATALAALPSSLPDFPEIDAFRRHLLGFGPAWTPSCAAVEKLKPMGAIPLIVLAAGALEMPALLPATVRADLLNAWHALQRDHAARSSRGELRIVADSGHNIARDQPAAVIDAIKEVIASASTPFETPF